MSANPFFEVWTTPFEIPPFDRIETGHFREAYDVALSAHKAEIAAIINDPARPDFENTIVAMERAGEALKRVGSVFWNLAGTESTEALRAVEREMSPLLARHYSEIFLDPTLFARVDAVFEARAQAGYSPEELRVLERKHKAFIRAGAKLGEAQRQRLGAITEELATLGTRFSQNVLKDESGFVLVLETEEDLAGLPVDFRAAAAALATERGHQGKWAVSLSRGNVEAFLTHSIRRDLRETLFRHWSLRGETGGETDNGAVIARTLALRAERARLLGYETYADFKLDDTMAETPDAVRALLDQVWTAGRARAGLEVGRLQAMIEAEGGNFELAPHDWRHYAEKLRRAEYAIDDAALRAYFPLDRMIEGAFHVAGELFGLRFEGLRGEGCAGAPCGAFHRRLFRPRQQAQRRLDVGLSRPAEAGARPAAHHRQCAECGEAPRRRARASDHRRSAHALSRIRPCAAWHVVECYLSQPCGHSRFVRLRGAALPAL